MGYGYKSTTHRKLIPVDKSSDSKSIIISQFYYLASEVELGVTLIKFY